MHDDAPRDPLEKKVRLGCGALAGIVFGLAGGFVALELTAGWLWAFTFAAVMVFAWAALRFGDRFWIGLLKFFGFGY